MDFDFAEVLLQVMERNASDLHLTAGSPPMIRHHGRLHALDYPRLTPQTTREVIYSILTNDQRQRLETDWQIDLAYSIPGKARFRVNAYFQRASIGAAFRLIPQEMPALADLGLAAMLDLINEKRREHIMTIEDPIEFLHRHKSCIVNQRELGADAQSFAMALKAALRQDPDVILVGEMRDLDTIATALTAAETGHLVFATLHTQDAAQTIDRIIDVFPANQQGQVRMQLSVGLQGIVTQTLIPTADGTGRCVASEILLPTPGVRNLIREHKTHQIYSLIQTGASHGMQTMDMSLATLVRAGKISLATAETRSSNPQELRRLLQMGGGDLTPAGAEAV